MNRRHNPVKIAVFWALTIALAAGVNAYFAGHPMYRNQAGEIDRAYRGLDAALDHGRETGRELTLIMGNSYVAASLITDLSLPPETGRFSTGGLPLKTIVEIVEHLPDDVPVRLLIVGLGYTYATPLDGGDRMFRKYWATNPLTRAWYSLPLVRSGDATSSMLNFTVEEFLAKRAGRAPVGNEDREAEQADRRSAAHARYIRRNAKDRLAEYRPYTRRVNPDFPALLRRLQRLCDERGIELFTYTAPISPLVCDRLDPAFLDEFRNAVAATGVRTIDLNLVFSDWDESRFNDATHPGLAGRRLIRDYLREYIENLDRRDPPPSLW